MPDKKNKIISLAIDLGSTRFKAAFLNSKNCLVSPISYPAPLVTSKNNFSETNAESVFLTASKLLADMKKRDKSSLPLAITSQRSSFLIWDKENGKPETPVITWQDRRGETWCKEHADKENMIWKRTGLPLLPYYLGPKIAAVFESKPTLKKKVLKGESLFGTLETFIIWKWTDRLVYQTDPTMAARTLLFDIHKMSWSAENLSLFNLSLDIMPEIMPTRGKFIPIKNGYNITCSVADQTASALSVLGSDTDKALVNLGTGGFVLRLTRSISKRFKGFLISPSSVLNGPAYITEGTINGIENSINKFVRPLNGIPLLDNNPHSLNIFCIPDSSGIGAPHWRHNIPLTFSKDENKLTDIEKGIAVAEGIIFRVIEILEGLFDRDQLKIVFLSGGNSKDSFIQQGIAACLCKPVYILDEEETTLKGGAVLANSDLKFLPPKTTIVKINPKFDYLSPKYLRWKRWVREIVDKNGHQSS